MALQKFACERERESETERERVVTRVLDSELKVALDKRLPPERDDS